MTDQPAEQPISGSASRGAVDLTGLSTHGRAPSGAPASRGRPTGAASPGSAGAGAAPGGSPPVAGGAGPGVASGAAAGPARPGVSGLVVEGNDANFTEVVNASIRVPSVVVLWSAGLPQSGDFLQVVIGAAAALDGRVQVVSVNVDANPGLLRAFQVQSVPMTLGLVQGQPVPLFAGIQPAEQVRAYLDELLKLAVQYGIAGRVDIGGAGVDEGAGEGVEPELPPLHQAAFDAIERDDLDGAAAAYEQALKENPGDTDAELGLAHVGLMRRTRGVDPAAARAAAAASPDDVDAAIMVADLDVLGGHVEDAFGRLIDLVKATAGDEREQARTHLLELFSIVGSHDERVRKARTALMSALF
ncbi:MAG TPA: tetratricopeptide repeat protein [Dermatophilaceae bacterium]|nr:tetratricopeptide repeat protein [Dermatophilaceae bacterium]